MSCGVFMVSHFRWLHELFAFFLAVCIILLLILLAAVPAHSQYQMTPNQRAVELIEDPVTPTSPGVLACLVLQVLFLAGMMISYLRISYQIESRDKIPHHHWWNRLHWRH